MAAFKRHLLDVDWRWTYGTGILFMQMMNLSYVLTIYSPLFRNGWWIVFTQVPRSRRDLADTAFTVHSPSLSPHLVGVSLGWSDRLRRTSRDHHLILTFPSLEPPGGRSVTQVSAEMAYSLTFVISVVIVPEITIPGFEGLIYGAITTYSNQSQNVANAINNLLLATWPSNGDDAALRSCAPHADANADAIADADAHADANANADADDATCAAVRWHMLLLTLLSVGIASCSILFLPLLPRQKCHVAELKAREPSVTAGRAMIILLVELMVVGTILSALPMFASTRCLAIAGGKGC